MSRFVAIGVLLALVVAGAALAARGDPQKKINAADQARAKAMLLRKSDVPAGFKPTPSSQDDDDFYCAPLDESDLTLTGEAFSPDFAARNPFAQGGVLFVSSYGQVYESVGDAGASWRRGTSAAGLKCLRDELRRGAQQSGDKVISVNRLPYPRLAQRAVAFRIVATTEGVRFQLDLVAFMQSRAHGGIAVASLPIQSPRAEVDRLARIVAARMKTAMRGA